MMERGGGQLEVSLDTLAQHMASAVNFWMAHYIHYSSVLLKALSATYDSTCVEKNAP